MKYPTVIEITEQWLKIIAVKPSLKGQEIAFLITKPAGSLNTESLKLEIAKLLNELKLTPHPLIVSFPRNLVTIRNLHLPSRDPVEIRGMVDINLPRQVPYPKEDIISGYEINGIDEAGYTKVILAIAHREALTKVFDVLDIAGLLPDRIELSSQGILSWFLVNEKPHFSSGELFILLDIDYNFTDFLVASKDNLLFTRTISHGFLQLSSDEELQKGKFIYELKQSLLNFQSEESGKKPTRIFLSGAVEKIANIDTIISEQLNLPVEKTKVFKNIINSKGVSLAQEEDISKLSISSILGLGLDLHRKRIQFVLPEIQIRKNLKERVHHLFILGTLLMYILIIGSAIFLEKTYNRQRLLKLLDSQIQLLGKDVNELDSISKKIKIVKERLDTRTSALNYLDYIHKLTPADIRFDVITFEAASKVTLRGEALQMSDVFKFITALENSGYFKNIETKYTSKRKVAEKEVAQFEINCPIILGKKK